MFWVNKRWTKSAMIIRSMWKCWALSCSVISSQLFVKTRGAECSQLRTKRGVIPWLKVTCFSDPCKVLVWLSSGFHHQSYKRWMIATVEKKILSKTGLKSRNFYFKFPLFWVLDYFSHCYKTSNIASWEKYFNIYI